MKIDDSQDYMFSQSGAFSENADAVVIRGVSTDPVTYGATNSLPATNRGGKPCHVMFVQYEQSEEFCFYTYNPILPVIVSPFSCQGWEPIVPVFQPINTETLWDERIAYHDFYLHKPFIVEPEPTPTPTPTPSPITPTPTPAPTPSLWQSSGYWYRDAGWESAMKETPTVSSARVASLDSNPMQTHDLYLTLACINAAPVMYLTPYSLYVPDAIDMYTVAIWDDVSVSFVDGGLGARDAHRTDDEGSLYITHWPTLVAVIDLLRTGASGTLSQGQSFYAGMWASTTDDPGFGAEFEPEGLQDALDYIGCF